MIKHCENCLGQCPENCKYCIYSNCKKEVDYHLVKYNYHKYLNAIDTDKENEREKEFMNWYKKYFSIN